MKVPDPLATPTLDVPAACALVGCSPWAGYQAIKAGGFPVAVVRIGRKIRVPTKPLLEVLGLA